MKLVPIKEWLFPVPDSWEAHENELSRSGPEGLLDPRFVPVESPLDGARLQLAREMMRGKNGFAELIVAGGRTLLFCSYIQSGCLVHTYTLQSGKGETELNAVYVFRPGNEAVAEEIRLHLCNIGCQGNSGCRLPLE